MKVYTSALPRYLPSDMFEVLPEENDPS